MTTTTDLDAAQTLDDAADLLLIHGVRRDGSSGIHEFRANGGGMLCAYGGMQAASGKALADHALNLFAQRKFGSDYMTASVFAWNDRSADDFEVIDGLRMVAKDIRNEHAPS